MVTKHAASFEGMRSGCGECAISKVPASSSIDGHSA